MCPLCMWHLTAKTLRAREQVDRVERNVRDALLSWPECIFRKQSIHIVNLDTGNDTANVHKTSVSSHCVCVCAGHSAEARIQSDRK